MSDDNMSNNELDKEEQEDNSDILNDLESLANGEIHKRLDARRRIENLMELRRLREIDESIGFEDLEY